MELSERVAGEIRAQMARQRRSARSVAEELGWSPFYLSRRLSGRTPLDVQDLAQLAEVLDVPVAAFFETPVGSVRKPGYDFTQLSLAVAA